MRKIFKKVKIHWFVNESFDKFLFLIIFLETHRKECLDEWSLVDIKKGKVSKYIYIFLLKLHEIYKNTKKFIENFQNIFSTWKNFHSKRPASERKEKKKRKRKERKYITTLSKYFTKQRKIKKCATWSFGDRVLRIVGVASEIAQHVVPSNRYSPGNIHGARDKHSYQIPSPTLYIMHIHQTVLSQKKKRKKKKQIIQFFFQYRAQFRNGYKISTRSDFTIFARIHETRDLKIV